MQLFSARERRGQYEQRKGLVEELILEGSARVREIAKDTVREMRERMGLSAVTTRLRRCAERHRNAWSQKQTDSGYPSPNCDDDR